MAACQEGQVEGAKPSLLGTDRCPQWDTVTAQQGPKGTHIPASGSTQGRKCSGKDRPAEGRLYACGLEARPVQEISLDPHTEPRPALDFNQLCGARVGYLSNMAPYGAEFKGVPHLTGHLPDPVWQNLAMSGQASCRPGGSKRLPLHMLECAWLAMRLEWVHILHRAGFDSIPNTTYGLMSTTPTHTHMDCVQHCIKRII